jgi:hypothetical protein
MAGVFGPNINNKQEFLKQLETALARTRSAERIVTRRRGHDEIEDRWAGWKGFSAQSWGAEACG